MCVVTLFYVVCMLHSCTLYVLYVCLVFVMFVMCVLSSRARSVDLHVVPDGNSMLSAGQLTDYVCEKLCM